MINKPIRVLHVVGEMGQGGTENFLMNVYRNINKQEIQFDFLVNRPGYFDEEIKKMGGNIFFIKALQKSGQIHYTKKLDEFFNIHKEYKIVHSHINQVTGLILERAKKAGIPIRIAHSHGAKSSKNLLIRIYKHYLGNKILKNATYCLACSNLAAKWLYKDNKEQAIIIKNGIETEKFIYSEEKRRIIRDELNIKDDSIVIGNIARFTKEKNHLFLIQIFSEYIKKNSNSYLVLVGQGKLENVIRNKVKKMGLEDNVKFLGIRKDTDYIYSAFDYFILPSVSEGLGIVLIEAQTAGLKCFASDRVVPEEAKISENLEYIELKNNANYWADRIGTINNYDRKDFRINNDYDINKVVMKLSDIYKRKVRG